MNKARDETAEARPMNTKEKETRSLKSAVETTERKMHTPASEILSLGGERTKDESWKRRENQREKTRPRQTNRKEGRRSLEARANEPKEERERKREKKKKKKKKKKKRKPHVTTHSPAKQNDG